MIFAWHDAGRNTRPGDPAEGADKMSKRNEPLTEREKQIVAHLEADGHKVEAVYTVAVAGLLEHTKRQRELERAARAMMPRRRRKK